MTVFENIPFVFERDGKKEVKKVTVHEFEEKSELYEGTLCLATLTKEQKFSLVLGKTVELTDCKISLESERLQAAEEFLEEIGVEVDVEEFAKQLKDVIAGRSTTLLN